MRNFAHLALTVSLAACASTPQPTKTEAELPHDEYTIEHAVETDARPAEDRERDADRKPIDVLRFFHVQPGQVVAELMGGRGYYTEILSRAVGPKGKVYAQNNKFVLEKFAEEPLSKRLEHPDLANVVRIDRELDDPGLPVGALDHALMILFYHDTFWMEVDRTKMNEAVFAALKPGGIYGIVDHHAQAGSKDRDVKTLHRIDVEVVKSEVLAAGFELVAESDVLAHPEDDRLRNVFDEAIRGKTDRFVLAFRKPR